MIAAFDLDGTLLKKNSSFTFCRFLREKRVFSRRDLLFCTYLYLQHCYLHLPLKRLHHLVFDRLFEGRKVEELKPYVEVFLDKHLQQLWYQPALFRLRALQKSGAHVSILSNSPRFIVEPIARRLGVLDVYATDYQVDGEGRLTGIATLVDGKQKAQIIDKQKGSRTLAFTDSYLDLPFLESAQIPIAVNPKYRLKKIAKARGWEIL